jgi:hypothetical protein
MEKRLKEGVVTGAGAPVPAAFDPRVPYAVRRLPWEPRPPTARPVGDRAGRLPGGVRQSESDMEGDPWKVRPLSIHPEAARQGWPSPSPSGTRWSETCPEAAARPSSSHRDGRFGGQEPPRRPVRLHAGRATGHRPTGHDRGPERARRQAGFTPAAAPAARAGRRGPPAPRGTCPNSSSRTLTMFPNGCDGLVEYTRGRPSPVPEFRVGRRESCTASIDRAVALGGRSSDSTG